MVMRAAIFYLGVLPWPSMRFIARMFSGRRAR
jgi:hypothetical protein